MKNFITNNKLTSIIFSLFAMAILMPDVLEAASKLTEVADYNKEAASTASTSVGAWVQLIFGLAPPLLGATAAYKTYDAIKTKVEQKDKGQLMLVAATAAVFIAGLMGTLMMIALFGEMLMDGSASSLGVVSDWWKAALGVS